MVATRKGDYSPTYNNPIYEQGSIEMSEETITISREELAALVAAQVQERLDAAVPLPAAAPAQANQVSIRDLHALASEVPFFSGDPRTTRVFLHKLQKAYTLALSTSPPTILTDEQKIRILLLRLTGPALKFVESLEKEAADTYRSPDLLLKQLEERYKPVDSEYEAACQLIGFRQGSLTIGDYAVRFDSLVQDAPPLPLAWRNIFFLFGLSHGLGHQVRGQQSDFLTLATNELITVTTRLANQRRQESQVPVQPRQQPQPRVPKQYQQVQPQQQSRQPPQQQLQQPAGSSHKLPAVRMAMPDPPAQRVYSAEEVQFLRSLTPVNGYKPATCAALHGYLNDSNPDREQLRAFIVHHRLCLRCRGPGHTRDVCPVRQ